MFPFWPASDGRRYTLFRNTPNVPLVFLLKVIFLPATYISSNFKGFDVYVNIIVFVIIMQKLNQMSMSFSSDNRLFMSFRYTMFYFWKASENMDLLGQKLLSYLTLTRWKLEPRGSLPDRAWSGYLNYF